jgi:YihY family inner membrane protein
MELRTVIRRLDRFQRAHGTLAFPIAVGKRFGEDGAGRLAATIAYFGFFSLFPLLMVLVTVAGLVLKGNPGLQSRLVESAVAQFPVVGTQIRNNLGSIEGSGLALVVGLAFAVWAGLGGIRAAASAMDTIWNVPRLRRPPMHREILRSLVMMTTLGAFVLAAALVGSVIGGSVGGAAGPWGIGPTAALNMALFAITYRVLTIADVSWRDVLPGAVLAGAGWTALLLLGGRIVSSRLQNASDVYGLFAVVIGLLTWLHLGAQLTLLGAEVNAVRARRLWPRSVDPDDLTAADAEALSRSVQERRQRTDQVVTVTFETDAEERHEAI